MLKNLRAKKHPPHIVEAYMTHSRTPFITEKLSDGRERTIGRRQFSDPIAEQHEMDRIRRKYGRTWTGIHSTDGEALSQPGQTAERIRDASVSRGVSS